MLRFFFLGLGLCVAACKSSQARNLSPETAQPRAVTQNSAGTKVKPQIKPVKKTAETDADEAAEEQAAQPVAAKKPILNPYEAVVFFEHNENDHKKFGIPRYATQQKKKKYGNSVVMQRSGRKRLYDHNLFLRALLEDHIWSETYGNLGEQFEEAVFLDIGSAILFGEGAETVRDLHEDRRISSKLTIIASDINDPAGKNSMYVKKYRESGEKLPFPVVEIAMLMDKPEHFTTPLKLFLKSGSGVILRSANSGPDLYYDKKQVQRHLRAAAMAFYERNVIYLFSKFILYKPKKRADFLVIGEIDDQVGTNHKKATWEEIDWDQRTFDEGVRLNPQHVSYR